MGTKKHGYLAYYLTKEGERQNCMVLYNDQRKEFSDYDKVLYKKVDEKFIPLKENGKQVVGLIRVEKLTIIGYIN